jgi:hypothetical protein
MKKIILSLLITLSLYADSYNVLIAEPAQSDYSMDGVNNAIFIGLKNQYYKIKRLLRRNNIDSVVEVPFFYKKHSKVQYQANKIMKNLMEDIYNMDKTDINTDLKNVNSQMNLDGNLDVSNIKMSDFKDISKKMSQKGTLSQLGEDAILKIGQLFLHKDINWVGEAKFHTFNSDNLVKLNAIYGMIFIPTVRGRTFTMSIRIYLINVNEDGKSVTVMIKTVKEFSWHKNPRYISAVVGILLKEILSLGTKQKIE